MEPMKSLANTVPEVLESVQQLVGIFSGLETPYGDEKAIIFRDCFGMVVAILACWRQLKPGETRKGVATKAWQGVKSEGMVLPKSVFMMLSHHAEILRSTGGAEKAADLEAASEAAQAEDEDGTDEQEEEEEESEEEKDADGEQE